MRLIFVILALCGAIWAHNLIFERDIIYHLNERDFRLQNGILSIDFAPNAREISNETLQTRHSTTTLNDNLKFYRHTRDENKFTRNLVRVRGREGGYFAMLNNENLKNSTKLLDMILHTKGANRAIVSEFSGLKNCFLLFKTRAQKLLDTKSHAVLLDLGDRIDFKTLSVGRDEVYFGCFGDGRYVF